MARTAAAPCSGAAAAGTTEGERLLQALHTHSTHTRSQQSSATTWPAPQKTLKPHKQINDKIPMQQPHFRLHREVHI